MRFCARTAVAALAAVALVGCSGPASGPNPSAPTSGSAGSAAPTTDVSTTTEPDTTATIDVPFSVQGDVGGVLRVDGREFDRFDAQSSTDLIATLGQPDDTVEQTQCFGDANANVAYRWGSLTVTVFRETPDVPYAEEFPLGAIAGWKFDPTTHDDDPMIQFSGPEAIKIGDTLDTLREAFEGGEWDSVGLDNDATDRNYYIFAGDTTGALFFLTPEDKVKSMSAGSTC